MTHRDNQAEKGSCARHTTQRSSPPPRHQILIQFVALLSSRSSRYNQPHFERITSQRQVQIYQELVSAPPEGEAEGEAAPVCRHDATPQGALTTSFLSICATVKDNRILPAGYLALADRKQIAAALGAGEDLAEDVGSSGVGEDPDYVTGGQDSLTFEVALDELPVASRPAAVQASLYYQATPPFYLQDRFCTSGSADTARLKFLVGHLNLNDTAADGWKLQVVSTGPVAITQEKAR